MCRKVVIETVDVKKFATTFNHSDQQSNKPFDLQQMISVSPMTSVIVVGIDIFKIGFLETA